MSEGVRDVNAMSNAAFPQLRNQTSVGMHMQEFTRSKSVIDSFPLSKSLPQTSNEQQLIKLFRLHSRDVRTYFKKLKHCEINIFL